MLLKSLRNKDWKLVVLLMNIKKKLNKYLKYIEEI